MFLFRSVITQERLRRLRKPSNSVVHCTRMARWEQISTQLDWLTSIRETMPRLSSIIKSAEIRSDGRLCRRTGYAP
jgi:hypothetical protein